MFIYDMGSLFKTIKWYAKAISQQTVIYGVGRLSKNTTFTQICSFFLIPCMKTIVVERQVENSLYQNPREC